MPTRSSWWSVAQQRVQNKLKQRIFYSEFWNFTNILELVRNDAFVLVVLGAVEVLQIACWIPPADLWLTVLLTSTLAPWWEISSSSWDRWTQWKFLLLLAPQAQVTLFGLSPSETKKVTVWLRRQGLLREADRCTNGRMGAFVYRWLHASRSGEEVPSWLKHQRSDGRGTACVRSSCQQNCDARPYRAAFEEYQRRHSWWISKDD